MDVQHQDSKGTTTVADVYKGFVDSTTMHGIGRALTSRSRLKRLMWSLLFLSCVGYSIFQLTEIVNKYNTYPVTTELNLKYNTRIKFPSITICNLNKLRSSKVSVDDKNSIQENYKKMGIEFENYIDDEVRRLHAAMDYDPEALHQFSDFLVDCMFNGSLKNEDIPLTQIPCTASNFTLEEEKSCFTFTPTDSKQLYTTKPGPQNGLLLELNVEHYEYLSLSPEAGIKVIVHDNDTFPFPQDSGIFVSPGASTGIGIRMTEIRRLPPPFGSCVGDKETRSTDLNLYSGEEYEYKYTENACRKSCYQFSLYKKCNCCDEDLPCPEKPIFKMSGVTPKKGENVRFCDLNGADSDCLFSVFEMYLSGGLDCSEKCQPACNQNLYETTVSTALWPTDQYLDVFMTKLNETEKEMYFIRQNFLRVKIYFETLEYTEITTKQSYEWNMLLSDIGGQLGLWLGFSLLTGIELLELVIDTIVVCFGRLCKTKITMERGNTNAIV